MVDKVKPLKIENSASGGTQNDPFPVETNPTQDYLSAKGMALDGLDTRLLDLNGSGQIQFKDAVDTTPFALGSLVKNFGTVANSLTASVQATAASTKTLVLASNTDQIFTGTTAGQILKLPVGTTLANGHSFNVWNLSTKSISIVDDGSNVLATLNANARTDIILSDNATSNGTWGLSYTLDNGNVFGTQAYYNEALSESSTTSTVTFLNKVTLTTPSLPVGDYIVFWQFIWRAANANRTLDARVQRAGVDVIAWRPFTANTADRQLISGFRRLSTISGVQTFTLDYKVSGTGTTVYMGESSLLLWRIG